MILNVKECQKLPEQPNVLPSCNFYNGSLKPANIDPNEVTNERCNNQVD